MKRTIGAIVTCFTITILNMTHAEEINRDIISTKPFNQKMLSDQKNQALIYIQKKLEKAGFSIASQEYILNVSKQQILANDNLSVFDKKLIDKNLYMLIEALIHDQHSSFLNLQLYQAGQYEKPWLYVTTASELELFNSHSAFSKLSLLEIQEAIKKLCPVWPFCKDQANPKKKH